MTRQRGFTLLEVLIAATILFAVLAAATETYRNALLASSRAQGLVSMLTPLPLITSAIRNQLRSNPSRPATAGRNFSASRTNGRRRRYATARRPPGSIRT